MSRALANDYSQRCIAARRQNKILIASLGVFLLSERSGHVISIALGFYHFFCSRLETSEVCVKYALGALLVLTQPQSLCFFKDRVAHLELQRLILVGVGVCYNVQSYKIAVYLLLAVYGHNGKSYQRKQHRAAESDS